MICLDTNVVIAALKDDSSLALQRVAQGVREGWPLAVSAIVLSELYFGAAKSAFPERNARRIAEFASSTIHVLGFEAEDAGFHEALRQTFLTIAQNAPERCVVVDAAGDPENVQRAVWTAVTERLPELARAPKAAAHVA